MTKYTPSIENNDDKIYPIDEKQWWQNIPRRWKTTMTKYTLSMENHDDKIYPVDGKPQWQNILNRFNQQKSTCCFHVILTELPFRTPAWQIDDHIETSTSIRNPVNEHKRSHSWRRHQFIGNVTEILHWDLQDKVIVLSHLDLTATIEMSYYHLCLQLLSNCLIVVFVPNCCPND